MFKIKLLILAAMLLLAARAAAAEQIWQEVDQVQARTVATAERQYQVDGSALRALLQRVTEIRGPGSQRTIRLPMPDGSFADFEIFESPIMADEVAQRYPEIRTFKVYGIDDPIASGRLDISPQGFHAMLHTSQGRLFIDPLADSGQPDRYQARTQNASPSPGYACGVDDFNMSSVASNRAVAASAARISGKFLQYRLAVAATTEYVQLLTGPAADVTQAQLAIISAISRVNEIYERDLGIQLMLVSDETFIEKGFNVVFSDGDPAQMFIQNQDWIDTRLTPSGYDIGHVFGTRGGGLAWLGSVCENGNKAKGVSAIPDPLGDPFYIDYVAHEIGHQFDADHSFNGSSGSCGPGRNETTAYEPGSGSSIMAYAGICAGENLQGNSDATFHAGSIAQINNYTSAGGSCFSEVPTRFPNPNEPIVSAITNRTIPANTPFELDGTASDGDIPGSLGQALSYQWDQLDAGCATDANSFGTDTGFNSLFRSYPPRAQSSRNFPALGTQLRGLYDKAEVLPCHNRDLNFRLTVRDQSSGQGTANVNLSVVDTGAAFEILNLNSGSVINSSMAITVNWRVAGTDQPPISCSTVDIDLLTFQDAAYSRHSVYPLGTVPNTPGTADVFIQPADQSLSHPRARIRIKCSNNIFYDISDVDFAIAPVVPETGNFTDSDIATFSNHLNPTSIPTALSCGVIVQCKTPPGGLQPGSGKGDSSALDYRWLLLLTGLLVLAHARRARRT